MKRFCENLKKLRVDNKFSQRFLAQNLNVTIKTISHWETGYSEPSITQLIKLAEIFDITVDELIK